MFGARQLAVRSNLEAKHLASPNLNLHARAEVCQLSIAVGINENVGT